VLKESPLIGNGLGSHDISRTRFMNDIQGIEFFIEMHVATATDTTANSLALHVLSEFGILGFLGVPIFLFHFHVGGRGPRAAISNAILVCFFLRLIRSGEYFQPDQFFFIFIYILNHRKFVRESSAVVRRTSLRFSMKPLNLLGRATVGRLSI